MSALRFTAAALLAATLLGCGDGEPKRYPVQGVITLDGKPYPDVTVEFVPDPSNPAITAGNDVSGPEGNFIITTMGRPGLTPGKYRVIATPKVADSAADAAAYEDEEQRRMSLEARGITPAMQAAKQGKPGGEFQAEVKAEDNTLSFDVKSTKAAR